MTVRSIQHSARRGRVGARLVVEGVGLLVVVVGAAGVVLAGGTGLAGEPVWLALVAALGILGWGGLFALRVRSGFGRSLERLTGAARRLAELDLERPPAAELPDELVSLADSLERVSSLLVRARVELARSEAAHAETRAELERATAATRRAEGTRAQFLSTMSHELRTPLNGVLGMAGLLAGEPLTGEGREWAQAVLSSARDLARQLDGIFDWIAVEDRSLVLERRTFRLDEVRDHAEGEFAPRVVSRGLAFTARFHAGLPRSVRGDRRRLLQILEHLIDNACKFTAAGEVHLDVRRGDGDEELVFEVRDTGTGFDRRALDTLFEPFTQADGSTTRRYDGVGLGLALAQRLARLMGGRVEVDESVRRGACVRLVVRLELAGEIGPEHGAKPGVDGGAPRRILVVDDNPVNRRLVAAVVRRAGHDPLLARDGLEAVDRFRSEAPDLILMDCFMPGLDGLGATRRIREIELRRGGAQVPIVALTAGRQRTTEARCREAGMDGFLEKPADPGELARALAEFARRPRHDAA